VVSTFPDGTSPAMIAAAVVPTGIIRSLWRQTNATQRMEGWSPTNPGVSDLRSVSWLDPLWLCVSATGELRSLDAGVAPVTLRCSVRSLPVGRSLSVWDVECALAGAPSGDAAFDVVAFSPTGRAVCRGVLSGGAGRCAGSLSVTLDEPGRPLRFYARTQPSAILAADEQPTILPPRR
jgi:hypothetical protein